MHRRIEGLERDVKQAREASEALAPALARLASLQKALASNDFAPAERRHLAGLDAKIAELGYDANAHKTAMARVRSLEQYADLHRKLQEAREGLPSEREGLQAAGEALKRRRDEAARLDAEREALRSAAALLSGSEEALAGALRTLARTESAHNEALRRQGALQGVLERCEAAVLEARGLEQQRGRLLDEKALYDDLERAFGRNGIPALIIEAAIPQLEVDANELLGRLTDGRMALKLELREGRKQKGVPTEALEIRIADEVGTRSYETFSGGEAFRINFALRIALSKLLARRSGAPLPILFVDEGFGSQDAAGQERLKESIQSIQNDFKKILVITHVEEMKDAFPVRIEVRKGPSGSTFTVT